MQVIPIRNCALRQHSWTGEFQRKGRVGRIISMLLAAALTALPTLNSVRLGQPVLGERFTALGLPSTALGLVATILAIAPAIIVARGKRRLAATG